MEESNNNIIIKVLAIILLIILGLNVYRTETTKKELATLSDTVSQIQSQVDSLEFPVGQPAVPVGTNSNQIKGLEKRVAGLESKVNTLKNSVDCLSKTSSPKSQQTSPLESTSSGPSSASKLETNSRNGGSGKVTVSAKVKVEDRYVNGSTVLPKVTKGPEGVVIIGIVMDNGGYVTSAKVRSGSTIKDEDILDACKEAALRTRFSMNLDVSDKHPATITYTFTAK